MLQDIQPHKLDNSYRPIQPSPLDKVVFYHQGNIAAIVKPGEISLPTVEQVGPHSNYRYLFSLDNCCYFALPSEKAPQGFPYIPSGKLRNATPRHIAYSLLCAIHLCRWYDENRLCSRCGTPMTHLQNERALQCPDCHITRYPTLCPAVIVAVMHNKKLLLTKYAGKEYTQYALIAGFAEFGETIEQTCQREVMEEVGLKIKNLRYYKSQPWPFSSSLLFGFFAQVDGDDTITLDKNELSQAEWFDIDNLPVKDDHTSLTREMMFYARNFVTED